MSFVPTGIKGEPNELQGLEPSKIQPCVAGYFSIDKNREYKNSTENLRYFRKPTRYPLNLNAGLGLAEIVRETKQEELLENLLQFLYHNKKEFLSKSPKATTVDFVCFRGVLRVIMKTPFESKRDWTILATRYENKIYLFEKETPRKKYINKFEEEKKWHAFGFKFKQYCMTSNPLKEPDTSVPVDERDEFYVVFKTKFSGMNLLYSANIDGALLGRNESPKNINKNDDLNALNLIDLKCCIRPKPGGQKRFFKATKCLNWYCQSVLVGINDLMIGYRNDEGYVDEVKHMEVKTLPQMGKDHWSPEQCTDFLKQFLEDVKVKMQDVNCPNTVYEFYFDPNTFPRNINFRKHPGKSSLTMLPKWFVEMSQ